MSVELTDQPVSTVRVADGPMVPARYRVTDRRQETTDSVTLSLQPVDAPIAEPEPGQFTMLYAFGVGEIPISVSGCPSREGALLHTIRAVGATSRALCALQPGEMLGVRGPFGAGWDVSRAEGRDVLVIAGGIGLAPLRPVIRHVLAERSRFGTVAFLIGARTPDDLLYAEQIDDWRSSGDIDVEVTVDAAARGWTGHVGLITTLLDPMPVDAAGATAFLCGPEVMLRVTSRQLVDAGADPNQVFVSLERNMHCAVRQCGHCQLGPLFVCADGPVVSWTVAGPLMAVRRW
jgi:anaerobic sulfite reductase subunit B